MPGLYWASPHLTITARALYLNEGGNRTEVTIGSAGTTVRHDEIDDRIAAIIVKQLVADAVSLLEGVPAEDVEVPAVPVVTDHAVSAGITDTQSKI